MPLQAGGGSAFAPELIAPLHRKWCTKASPSQVGTSSALERSPSSRIVSLEPTVRPLRDISSGASAGLRGLVGPCSGALYFVVQSVVICLSFASAFYARVLSDELSATPGVLQCAHKKTLPPSAPAGAAAAIIGHADLRLRESNRIESNRVVLQRRRVCFRCRSRIVTRTARLRNPGGCRICHSVCHSVSGKRLARRVRSKAIRTDVRCPQAAPTSTKCSKARCEGAAAATAAKALCGSSC